MEDKWISVKDALPAEKGRFERYLILIEGDNIIIDDDDPEKTYQYVDIAYCLRSEDAVGHEIYYWATDDDSSPVDRVLYWQPLPNPPQVFNKK